jgi:hypothetical protein
VAGDDGTSNASAATICADVDNEPEAAAQNTLLSIIDEPAFWSRFVFRADRLAPRDAELTRRGEPMLPAGVAVKDREDLAPELFGRTDLFEVFVQAILCAFWFSRGCIWTRRTSEFQAAVDDGILPRVLVLADVLPLVAVLVDERLTTLRLPRGPVSAVCCDRRPVVALCIATVCKTGSWRPSVPPSSHAAAG